MVLLSNREELLASWRALTGNLAEEGLHTIPVGHRGPCLLLAGRHFPGNEEALIVGFSSNRVPHEDQLPQSHGFLVSKAALGEERADRIWIAIRRQRAGTCADYLKKRY